MAVAKAPLVAIVDDDIMVREATADLVETFGFDQRTFASAEEFINSERVSRISCLIADVQMPGIDGLQLQQNLTTSGRLIPVILSRSSRTSIAENGH